MILGINTLEKITGSDIKFIRFPRFRYRPLEKIELPNKDDQINNLFQKINDNKIRVIDYSINTHDWDLSVSDKEIIDSIMNNISNSSIIVLHDGSENESELKNRPARTLKLLPKIIESLTELGYELINLENLDLNVEEKIFYEK